MLQVSRHLSNKRSLLQRQMKLKAFKSTTRSFPTYQLWYRYCRCAAAAAAASGSTQPPATGNELQDGQALTGYGRSKQQNLLHNGSTGGRNKCYLHHEWWYVMQTYMFAQVMLLLQQHMIAAFMKAVITKYVNR